MKDYVNNRVAYRKKKRVLKKLLLSAARVLKIPLCTIIARVRSMASARRKSTV